MEMSTEGTNWESTDSFLLWRVFVWEDNIGVGKAAAVEWPDSQNCLCLKVSDLAVIHPPGLTSRTCRRSRRQISGNRIDPLEEILFCESPTNPAAKKAHVPDSPHAGR